MGEPAPPMCIGFSGRTALLACKPPDVSLQKQLLRCRCCACRRLVEARHHPRQVAEAVEPVHELVQVSLRLLSLYEAADAPKHPPNIADGGVQLGGYGTNSL